MGVWGGLAPSARNGKETGGKSGVHEKKAGVQENCITKVRSMQYTCYDCIYYSCVVVYTEYIQAFPSVHSGMAFVKLKHSD